MQAPPSLVPVLPPRLVGAGRELVVYGVEFLPLAVSANRQAASFKVEEDHAFLIVAMNAFLTTADNAAIALQEMRALVTIYHESDRQQVIQPTVPLANDAPLENLFGSGQAWNYLSYPWIVRPNDTVTVLLSNLEATARNYRLSFIGCRIYRSRAVDPWAYFRGGF